jgi:hypothetical protein
MADMTDGQSALGEAPRYQEAAMTIERLALRTHDANARLRDGVEQAVEAGVIVGLRRHGFVVGNAVAIKTLVARPAAKRFPQCGVTDTGSQQRCRQPLLREPRKEPRVGRGPHVDDHACVCVSQHRQEMRLRNVGVTDAEQVERRHGCQLLSETHHFATFASRHD